jgi:hypothetical protein
MSPIEAARLSATIEREASSFQRDCALASELRDATTMHNKNSLK